MTPDEQQTESCETWMLNKRHKNGVFQLVNMEMEAFEQTLPLQKDGDVGLQKYQLLVQLQIISKKGNEILQQNILTYFKKIFNVIQRKLIIRRGGDDGS